MVYNFGTQKLQRVSGSSHNISLFPQNIDMFSPLATLGGAGLDFLPGFHTFWILLVSMFQGCRPRRSPPEVQILSFWPVVSLLGRWRSGYGRWPLRLGWNRILAVWNRVLNRAWPLAKDLWTAKINVGIAIINLILCSVCCVLRICTICCTSISACRGMNWVVWMPVDCFALRVTCGGFTRIAWTQNHIPTSKMFQCTTTTILIK